MLIRGGITSVGLAAAALAKQLGVYVLSTSREASADTWVKSSGADELVLDMGSIAEKMMFLD